MLSGFFIFVFFFNLDIPGPSSSGASLAPNPQGHRPGEKSTFLGQSTCLSQNYTQRGAHQVQDWLRSLGPRKEKGRIGGHRQGFARGLSPPSASWQFLACCEIPGEPVSLSRPPPLPSSPPTSGFPRLVPKLFSAANEAPVKKLLSPSRMSFLQESPSDPWAPYHPSIPEPPPLRQGSPQGRFASPDLVFAFILARPFFLKGSGTPPELKVKTLGRCLWGLSPPPGAGCGRPAWRPPFSAALRA